MTLSINERLLLHDLARQFAELRKEVESLKLGQDVKNTATDTGLRQRQHLAQERERRSAHKRRRQEMVAQLARADGVPRRGLSGRILKTILLTSPELVSEAGARASQLRLIQRDLQESRAQQK